MRILDRLPISDEGWMVQTPDGEDEVKPFQIIVFVSITARNVVVLPDDAPRIPAVLDTGNNHNLAIRQRQLQQWVRLALPQKGKVEVGGFIVPRFASKIWIHPNREGTIEASGVSPFMLELVEGIIVYPHDIPNPARLPILGLRAIIRNGLKLTIDGATRGLTMESPTP